MPLTSPSPRKLSHHRRIDCYGYQREDGLWDIEGRMTDQKTYGFDNADRGRIEAGDYIHEMWLRLTIDLDFKIHRIEAQTDAGPFRLCGSVDEDFRRLEGQTISGGFLKQVRLMFAGTAGCTHLVELFGPLATTAYQTMFLARHERDQERDKGQPPKASQAPALLGSCRAFAPDDEVVKRLWPDFYTGS